jgi:hypothetical protein
MHQFEIEVYETEDGRELVDGLYPEKEAMNAPGKPFDFSFRDDLLRDADHAAFYLEQILESGNLELFQEALRTVAKAQDGGVRPNIGNSRSRSIVK